MIKHDHHTPDSKPVSDLPKSWLPSGALGALQSRPWSSRFFVYRKMISNFEDWSRCKLSRSRSKKGVVSRLWSRAASDSSTSASKLSRISCRFRLEDPKDSRVASSLSRLLPCLERRPDEGEASECQGYPFNPWWKPGLAIKSDCQWFCNRPSSEIRGSRCLLWASVKTKSWSRCLMRSSNFLIADDDFIRTNEAGLNQIKLCIRITDFTAMMRVWNRDTLQLSKCLLTTK